MNPNLRGQRISKEDLINESQEVLLKSGVGNHSRAQFLSEVCQEAVGSQNPLFSQLQPKIRSHENQSWITAFRLIIQYLVEHELRLTIKSIESEFNQGKLPKELTDYNQVEIDDKFEQILRASSPLPPKSFQERVEEYMDDVKQHDLESKKSQISNDQKPKASTRKTPTAKPYRNENGASTNPKPQKNRSTKKPSTKQAPQTVISKPASKNANKSYIKSKSSTTSRQQSKKMQMDDSDLIDDFIIEEVIMPRD